jgi:hypothetical protein
VAGDQDIDVPGGLSQPVECRLVGAYLIGTASVKKRDQDIGEHVTGEQDSTVREEDRCVADGVGPSAFAAFRPCSLLFAVPKTIGASGSGWLSDAVFRGPAVVLRS